MTTSAISPDPEPGAPDDAAGIVTKQSISPALVERVRGRLHGHPAPTIAVLFFTALAVSEVALSSALPPSGSTASLHALGEQSASQLSAADLVDRRSPGGRGVTTLNKFKAAHAVDTAPAMERRSRLIPRRARQTGASPIPAPSAPFDLAALTAPEDLLAFTPAVAQLGDLAPLLPRGLPFGAAAGPAPIGITNVTGSPQPGGGGAGPDSPPDVTPTPVSQVPEPSVWLTMLLGFCAIGWILRRRPADALALPAAAWPRG